MEALNTKRLLKSIPIFIIVLCLMVPLKMWAQNNSRDQKLPPHLQEKIEQMRKHLQNKNDRKHTSNQLQRQQSGAIQQSISTGYELLHLTHDQSWNRNPNPNPKNNFPLFSQGQPAGDINGDSRDDYIVTGRGRDEQTSTLEDFIWKTAVFYGGNATGEPDNFFYRELIPVGDLNGDGFADAIASQSGIIYQGSESGYSDSGKSISGGFNSGQKQIGFHDFNRDGYDDILSYDPGSEGNIFIIWGASNLTDVVSAEYYEILSYDNKRVVVEDVDQDSLKEIVELSGMAGSNGRINVFEVDTAAVPSLPNYEDISSQQSFSYSDFNNYADQNDLHLLDINGTGYYEIYISEGRYGQKHVVEYDSVNEQYLTTPINFFNGSLVPAGDLDNDGNHDFIRGDSLDNYMPYIAYGNDNLNNEPALDYQLSGNGGSKWSWRMIYNPYSNFGDLTGDGVDDVLMNHRREDAGNKMVGRRILNGATQSSQFHEYPYDNYYSAIWETEEVGDLNGDGVEDLAMTLYDQQKLEIYFGGNINSPAKSLELTFYPRGITAGDFNNDSYSDIVVGGYRQNGSVFSVFLGGSTLNATPVMTITAAELQNNINNPDFFNPENIGDVNNDGFEDFLIGSSNAHNADSDTTYINNAYLFYGGNTISKSPTIISLAPTGSDYIWAGEASASLGDINGDGIDDFAVGIGAVPSKNNWFGKVHIYYGKDSLDPSFTNPDKVLHAPQYIYGFGWGVTAGDFTGDGVNDIAVSSLISYKETGDHVLAHVFTGGPNMDNIPDRSLAMPKFQFGNSVEITGDADFNYGRVEAIPDFNKDGKDELFFGSAFYRYTSLSNAAIYVLDGENQDAIIALEAPNKGAALGSENMAIGDFTNDGQIDLVLTQRDDFNDALFSSRVYRYGLPGKTVAYDMQNGWNLVGVALDADEQTVQSLSQSINYSSIYGYDGGYSEVEIMEMESGRGYWMNISTADIHQLKGFPFTELDINLKKGWNLISGISGDYAVDDIQDPDEILIDETLYGFDQAYSLKDTLRPSKGYWIRASSAGTVTFMDSSLVTNLFDKGKGYSQEYHKIDKKFSKITITDGNNSRELYFGATLPDEMNKLRFSLPPLPPGNSFDARFNENRRLTEEGEASIKLSKIKGTSLKLKIEEQNSAEHGQFLIKEYADGKFLTKYQVDTDTEFELRKNNTTTISFAPVGSSVLSQEGIPEKFELKQNFPNPFNPTTQIQYSIINASTVKLDVFNILGRKVKTLVNKEQDPGHYKVTFDASSLASGVYLYRLRAGSKISTKKLILVK